jgi:hypothetical protein
MATAAPGIVLCVADRIVRIVVHVVTGEDLGGRPRREIDLLIGVAAGQDKRCDHDRDAHRKGASQLNGTGQWDVRLVDVQEKSAIRFSYWIKSNGGVRLPSCNSNRLQPDQRDRNV